MAVVVGRRLAGTGRIDALAAVDRPAVHQHAELPVGREQHPLDAEEVAFDVQRTAFAQAGVDQVDREQRREAKGEPQRAVPEAVAYEHRDDVAEDDHADGFGPADGAEEKHDGDRQQTESGRHQEIANSIPPRAS